MVAQGHSQDFGTPCGIPRLVHISPRPSCHPLKGIHPTLTSGPASSYTPSCEAVSAPLGQATAAPLNHEGTLSPPHPFRYAPSLPHPKGHERTLHGGPRHRADGKGFSRRTAADTEKVSKTQQGISDEGTAIDGQRERGACSRHRCKGRNPGGKERWIRKRRGSH